MTSPACCQPGCGRAGHLVMVVVCAAGHDEVVRLCGRHGLDLVAAQAAQCPLCRSTAAAAVYCGMCRRGAHGDCRAVEGLQRVLADLPPRRAEDYCACTCDDCDDLVPGAGLARQPAAAEADT